MIEPEWIPLIVTVALVAEFVIGMWFGYEIRDRQG